MNDSVTAIRSINYKYARAFPFLFNGKLKEKNRKSSGQDLACMKNERSHSCNNEESG